MLSTHGMCSCVFVLHMRSCGCGCFSVINDLRLFCLFSLVCLLLMCTLLDRNKAGQGRIWGSDRCSSRVDCSTKEKGCVCVCVCVWWCPLATLPCLDHDLRSISCFLFASFTPAPFLCVSFPVLVVTGTRVKFVKRAAESDDARASGDAGG